MNAPIMIPIYLIVVSFFTTTGSHSVSYLDTEWTLFKKTYGKSYESAYEDAHRRNIFEDNLAKIQAHNEQAERGEHTHKLGITKFADLTSEEMKSSVLRPDSGSMIKAKTTSSLVFDEKNQIPEYIDWRSKGIVTPVKDQGLCSACWAFSTLAAIESAYAQATGKLVELSEQNLIDCSVDSGCATGQISKAHNYAITKGVDRADCYPYESSKDKSTKSCKFNSTCAEVKISSMGRISAHNEDALRLAVAQRVIPVYIDGENDDFLLYKEGILNSKKCRQDAVSHAVALVGYGAENGVPYWIFKNSWGSAWGENGFGRLLRGNNTCGIVAYDSLYPIL